MDSKRKASGTRESLGNEDRAAKRRKIIEVSYPPPSSYLISRIPQHCAQASLRLGWIMRGVLQQQQQCEPFMNYFSI